MLNVNCVYFLNDKRLPPVSTCDRLMLLHSTMNRCSSYPRPRSHRRRHLPPRCRRRSPRPWRSSAWRSWTRTGGQWSPRRSAEPQNKPSCYKQAPSCHEDVKDKRLLDDKVKAAAASWNRISANKWLFSGFTSFQTYTVNKPWAALTFQCYRIINTHWGFNFHGNST